MSPREYAEHLNTIITVCKNVTNETKDLEICDFVSIIGSTIEIYAISHDMPVMNLWVIMYKLAQEANKE